MSGSTLGTLFSITTWGESHGAGIGVVIDGCPSGLSLCEHDIQVHLNRRKPGQSSFTTQRKESDKVQILSGIYNGKTTGTPISIFVPNEDHYSQDYDKLKDCYRPGHADYTYDAKYGFRDYRGGGRSSGRETIGRVCAGAIAFKILEQLGVHVRAYTKSIGNIIVPSTEYNYDCIYENKLYMPNNEYAELASDYLEKCIQSQDSSGGIIECIVSGMPAGIGEPVFHKLDATLAKALMSIGSVKGVEIGDGFKVSESLGSQNNDSFILAGDTEKNITKSTNHCGGILGGISDGDEIILRVAIKPTPSIAQAQNTITTSGEETCISITGRHDPVIVPRAVVVVESMVAITLLDLMFMNLSSTMDNLQKIYNHS